MPIRIFKPKTPGTRNRGVSTFNEITKTKPEKLKGDAFFNPIDTFYDLEEIRENGKNARYAMEQRALDTILKRIVNENFEW